MKTRRGNLLLVVRSNDEKLVDTRNKQSLNEFKCFFRGKIGLTFKNKINNSKSELCGLKCGQISKQFGFEIVFHGSKVIND